MTTVDLIYCDAGGGHRAAAAALEAVIRAQQRPWQVRRVNLFQALDPQDRIRRITGAPPEAYYNRRLASGWTLGLAQELKLLQGLIRYGHASLVKRLARHWRDTRPDLVVSLVPNFNRALHQSLAAARPGVPCVTVMTDLADFPPRFWIDPGSTAHLVCGSARAVAQARALGVEEQRIHRCSGMIVRPDFYDQLALDRTAERMRLGLDPARTTGVVMFGGQGSTAMLEIARRLDDVQLILLCGRHRALADALRREPSGAPRAVVEFTPEVRRYLMLADFFIGKPGPGSLSEAVQQGLPIVTLRNRWTLPQERYNADWVREQGLGLVIGRVSEIGPAVAALQARLDAYRANVRAQVNRAVFEVPEILAAILESRAPEVARPGGIAHAATAQPVTRLSSGA
ncbi:MAG: galactosyldiacylglycerol synthase [Ideonella sp.]|nr:galactosyldiacylglycerol synthase [Ideonella sp.]